MLSEALEWHKRVLVLTRTPSYFYLVFTSSSVKWGYNTRLTLFGVVVQNKAI